MGSFVEDMRRSEEDPRLNIEKRSMILMQELAATISVHVAIEMFESEYDPGCRYMDQFFKLMEALK
jgi:hypothetical protein